MPRQGCRKAHKAVKALLVGETSHGHDVKDPVAMSAFKVQRGGSRLRTDFGIKSDLEPLAEAWVLSCHPDGPSYLPDGTTLADYAAAQKYMGVYVVTVDDDKDAEGVARDLLARWQAAEDKESEYAAICEELGQEIGSAVTLAAVEGDPLSSAIEALEVGGMDAVIDPYEDGTCYVVMRTETDMSAVAQTYFDVLWEQRLESAVVVTNSKLYDAIDAGTFYQALAQLRADMAAENGDAAA